MREILTPLNLRGGHLSLIDGLVRPKILELNMTKIPKIKRRPEVEAKTGLSRSTIYEKMKNGTFPKPVKLGPRAVGWLEIEIDAWICERISQRGKST